MRIGGGNKIYEAARQEILDRNASEGIEPRNFSTSKRPTVFICWKAARADSLCKNMLSLSGSKSAVRDQVRGDRNLGDPAAF